MHLLSHVDLWLAFSSQLQELCDRGIEEYHEAEAT